MRTIGYLICFMLSYTLHAQDVFPRISVSEFEEDHSNEIVKETILLVNAEVGIILSGYGNQACEYTIVAHNEDNFIIGFEQPSHLNPKGRCAAGTERGFLVFKLNEKAEVIGSDRFLTESCLMSIEIIDEHKSENDIVEYTCENYQTSEKFKIRLDTKHILILKSLEN